MVSNSNLFEAECMPIAPISVWKGITLENKKSEKNRKYAINYLKTVQKSR
jgi:hypothetical protein